jgi:FkbM family methyltransferase
VISATKLAAGVRLLRYIEFNRKLGICERLFARRLAKLGIVWVDTSAGLKWKLDLRNSTHRWIVYGKYEGAPFLDWALRFLPENGIIIDSGANIGQMLLYLAQWVPQGRVIAVEPGKHQADWLQECLTVNSQLPVSLLRVGLGDKQTTAFLEEPGSADRHGSWNRVSQTNGETIQIVRLDDLLQEQKIDMVDLWKLDVEGFEIPALIGAERYLMAKRIRSLYVELRGENGREIRRYLGKCGYECFLFSARGKLYQPAVWPDEANGLFLPRG